MVRYSWCIPRHKEQYHSLYLKGFSQSAQYSQNKESMGIYSIKMFPRNWNGKTTCNIPVIMKCKLDTEAGINISPLVDMVKTEPY